MKKVRLALLDTETTGGSHTDEPITVGVVLLEVDAAHGEVLQELEAYHGLREPAVINPFAFRVHGIRMDALRGKRWDMGRLAAIAKAADLVVAHNAPFDRRMMAKVAPEFDVQWACSIGTLRNEWKQITGRGASLDAICAALGIVRPPVHDAMDDCRTLQRALGHTIASAGAPERLMRRLVERAGVCE